LDVSILLLRESRQSVAITHSALKGKGSNAGSLNWPSDCTSPLTVSYSPDDLGGPKPPEWVPGGPNSGGGLVVCPARKDGHFPRGNGCRNSAAGPPSAALARRPRPGHIPWARHPTPLAGLGHRPGSVGPVRLSPPTRERVPFTFARNAPKLLPRHFSDRRLRSVPSSASFTSLGTARISSPQHRRTSSSLQAAQARPYEL
jgi:hypothetical protein